MTAATSQTPCPAGSYQPLTGQTTCRASTPGNFVATSGSNSQQQCGLGPSNLPRTPPRARVPRQATMCLPRVPRPKPHVGSGPTNHQPGSLPAQMPQRILRWHHGGIESDRMPTGILPTRHNLHHLHRIQSWIACGWSLLQQVRSSVPLAPTSQMPTPPRAPVLPQASSCQVSERSHRARACSEPISRPLDRPPAMTLRQDTMSTRVVPPAKHHVQPDPTKRTQGERPAQPPRLATTRPSPDRRPRRNAHPVPTRARATPPSCDAADPGSYAPGSVQPLNSNAPRVRSNPPPARMHAMMRIRATS